MTSITSEVHFEDLVIESLTIQGGWKLGSNSDYNPNTALIINDLIQWFEISNPQGMNKLKNHNNWKELIIEALSKSIKDYGIIKTIHKELIVRGFKFKLIQFKPNGNINSELVDLYNKNQLTVLRQLHYSKFKKEVNKSLDLALFVNGIPIATLELKTDNNQSITDAINQYKNDRHLTILNEPEPLFTFNERCLVHFAVSTSEVWMTTKLNDAATRFMPFNKNKHSIEEINDNENKDLAENDFKVSYLYKEVLAYDSILDIVDNYIVYNKTNKAIYFPRYHQLDGVRKVINHVRQYGVGSSYLFEHSAGSGKSNTISWLVAQLYSLHADTKAVFNKIIIITDRKILDQQIKENMRFIFQEKNALKQIERSSELTREINSPTRSIIITTIQKFKYALEKISTQSSLNKYAIVIDEAHSSQSGKHSKSVEKACTNENIDDSATLADQEIEDTIEAMGAIKNISYFAFTATPSDKTYQIFGTRPFPLEDISDTNIPYAFHTYSMEQAINEGYIIDVLAGHYVKYDTLRMLSSEYHDAEIDYNSSASIKTYVDELEENVKTRSELITKHFIKFVYPLLGYRAKAMVVTSSRRLVCLLKSAIDEELKSRNLASKIKTLGAFEGTVKLNDNNQDEHSESTINDHNVKGDRIKSQFESDDYKILIVANKFQTGFDQPLLCGMYIDKFISGAAAVQTLSRLNRSCQGKNADSIHIFDFKNSYKGSILPSFAQYYQGGKLGKINKFDELISIYESIIDTDLVFLDEINSISNIFKLYNKNNVAKATKNIEITNLLDMVYERYLAVNELKQSEFSARIFSFMKAFGLLPQLYNYHDVLHEYDKMNDFCSLIKTRISKKKIIDETYLSSIILESIACIKEFSVSPSLKHFPGAPLEARDFSEVKGKPKSKDFKILLDLVLGNLRPLESKLDFFNSIISKLINNSKLITEAKNNEMASFYNGSFFDVLKRELLNAGIENEASRYNDWYAEPENTAYPFVKVCEVEIYNILRGEVSFSEYTSNIKHEIDKIKLQQEELIKKRNDALLIEGCDPDED